MYIKLPALAVVATIVVTAMVARAAPQAGGSNAIPGAAARNPSEIPAAALFFKETWTRKPGEKGTPQVGQINVSSPSLVLNVYGRDAKNLVISGPTADPTYLMNLWNGLSTEPVAATLRDTANYVDLSAKAKIRWTIRTAGFHVVRPVLKLADGTLLVGDRADASTTLFTTSEFAIADVRWIKLDPARVVTLGTYGPSGQTAAWVENPDLSKVDEVGFTDLMPGSGHGAGGWINVAAIEVYGRPVKR